jgi:LacI family transcriptional regulator
MATLKDIARESGVSINTVSCALRGSPRVSGKLAEKIRRIAKEMDYTPNAAARALRIKKSKVIGVIVTDVSNPVFGKMVKGVEAAIKQKDYSIIICNTDEEYSMEEDAVSTMIAKGVDGVIITPTQQGTQSLDLMRKAGIPYVLMGRRFEDGTSDYVVSDDHKGGYITGEYFISKGHKDIIFINGPERISSSREREKGLEEALAKAGTAPRNIYNIMPDIHEGYILMKKLLSDTIDFTGVFCFDDYTAFGVIRAIREKKLRIPEDIAVIGYDNTVFAEMPDMGLTSVDFNEYRIGELAAGLIMDIVNRAGDGNDAPKHIVLEPHLVIRGSA